MIPQQDGLAGDLSVKLPKLLPPVNIVVTGSGTWWSRSSVWTPLDRLRNRHERLTLFNGKARRGLDRFVSEWIEQHKADERVVDVPLAADWDRLGHRAGFIRNQRLIDEALIRGGDTGDIMVLAWANPCRRNQRWCPPGAHPTHGTADCVKRARDSGIPVYFHPRSMKW